MERTTDAPMHSVIRQELLAQITAGRYQPGDRIPTEPELIHRYGVSRTTVRRALRDLEMRGLIHRYPGRGSFVSEPDLVQNLERLTGFVEDMSALGLDATADVITIEKVAASKQVAHSLRLNVGEKTIHIERVRLANGQPISFDDSYFPESLGARIANENLEVEPFYSILEEKYGMELADAEYVLAAAVATPRVAELLQLEANMPILLIERTSRVKSAPDPVLFEYLHYRGDRMRYRLTLQR